MVQLEEVEDETFESKQIGPSEDEDEYTDTDSEISSDDEEYVTVEESFTDRLYALRDIIPATTRNSITSKISTTTSWVQSGLLFGGKTLWVVSTTALLFGVPWALAFADEQMQLEMENEQKMREIGGEMLSSASDIAGNLGAGTGAQPAL